MTRPPSQRSCLARFGRIVRSFMGWQTGACQRQTRYRMLSFRLGRLSENGLHNLVLSSEAQLMVIACDNDANGAGQAAARDAAWLWTEAGWTVRVMLPPRSNTDFKDILNGAY